MLNSRIIKKVASEKMLDQPLVKAFLQAEEQLLIKNPRLEKNVPYIFFGFLDLTGQKLVFLQLNCSIEKQMKQFVGFCYYELIKVRQLRSIFKLLRIFIRIINQLFEFNGLNTPPKFPKLSEKSISTEAKLCITEYKKLSLSEERYEYYQGWSCKTKEDDIISFDLSKIYNLYGEESCRLIWSALQKHIRKKVTTSAYEQKSLFNTLSTAIIELYPTKHRFDDVSKNTNIGVESLFKWLRIKNEKKSRSTKNFYEHWKMLVKLIDNILIQGNIWDSPTYELYSPNFKSSTLNANTNIQVGEQNKLIIRKSITPIPLEYSDNEVIKELFTQINSDVEHVVISCRRECKKIIKRYNRRKVLAAKGKIKIKLPKNTSIRSTHPNYVSMVNQENQCATFRHYNFNYKGDKYTEFLGFGGGIKSKDFAHNFSLLHAYILIPYIFLLIREHQEITDSWLLNFELYDKNGNYKGLKKVGSIWIASSVKKRKGHHKAQQDIALNPESKKIFNQIIELTSEARKWLKTNKDDNWRYLFLSCQGGFSKPRRLKQFQLFSFLTENSSYNFLSSSLLKASSQTDKAGAKSILENLNFSSMRNSCALLVFLETRSAKKMSEALGHEEYHPKLLSHYLPTVILEHFYSRWIRLFQTALLFEALKTSSHIYQVLPFTPETLDIFIKNHAIKNFSQFNEVSNAPHKKGKVELRVPLSFDLLLVLQNITTLIDTAGSDQKITKVAVLWYEWAKYILNTIDSNQVPSDIVELLKRVRSAPSIKDKLIGAVYE